MSQQFFQEQREQSIIKARIVSKYFSAWARVILGVQKKYRNRSQKMAYVDLFAGPGRYDDQSKSTPLLVLETILANPELSQRVVTMFNDKDEANIGSLREGFYIIVSNLLKKHGVMVKEQGVQIFLNHRVLPVLVPNTMRKRKQKRGETLMMGFSRKGIFSIVIVLLFTLLVGCTGGGSSTYTASGKVIDDKGKALAGVKLIVTGGTSIPDATVEADGTFILSKLTKTCIITPHLEGYVFTPKSATIKAATTKLQFSGAPMIMVSAISVSGDAVVGKTLTATANTEHVTYQWLRDDVEISGATGKTYTLTGADENKYIKVKVTGKSGLATGDMTSDPTVQVKLVNAEIGPASGTFYHNDEGDITATITWNSATKITKIITSGVELVENADYTVAGNTLTIKKEYFMKEPISSSGATGFGVEFDRGSTVSLTVNIATKYQVVFDASDGSGTMDEAIAANDQVYTFPSNEFTPPGEKVFDKWKVKNNGTEEYYAEGATKQFLDGHVESDGKTIKVYAVWEDIPKYVVTFSVIDNKGGTITAAANGAGINSGDQVAKGSNLVFTAAPSTGYEIKQWKYNGTVYGGTEKDLEHGPLGEDFNVTVEFEATTEKYTVTYDENGGTGTVPESAQYAASATVIVAEKGSLTKEHFLFDGWNTEANGSGTAYGENDTFNIAADITLYAQWTPVITSILINKSPTKTEYADGENLDLDGLIVKVNYANNH